MNLLIAVIFCWNECHFKAGCGRTSNGGRGGLESPLNRVRLTDKKPDKFKGILINVRKFNRYKDGRRRGSTSPVYSELVDRNETQSIKYIKDTNTYNYLNIWERGELDS